MPNVDEEHRIWSEENEEELVFAFDVGTTQSAACVVLLVPGHAPKFKVVQLWPESTTSSKIPSVILYDANGQDLKSGAEALNDKFESAVVDGELFHATWFKLWLPISEPSEDPAPSSNASRGLNSNPTFELKPLPPNTTGKKCYSDMLRYLFVHAKNYWFEVQPDAATIWKTQAPKFKVVLGHPNTWNTLEQSVLKQSVIDAGIMTIQETETRLRLVSEAEASVHFGIFHVGQASAETGGWLSKDSQFAVVDAGGGTVDTCVYTVKQSSPKLILHEAKASDCVQAGAVFVSQSMETFIKNKIKGSEIDTEEYVKIIMDRFDSKTKLDFSDPEELQKIKVGLLSLTVPEVSIRRGSMEITGAEMEAVFKPAVDSVIESIKRQIGNLPVKHILLVGGFGQSGYLKRKIRNEFDRKNIQLITADEASQKAVAMGAAIFYARNSVRARVTRFEFGIASNRAYTQALNSRRLVKILNHKCYYDGGWTQIVDKGVPIESDDIKTQSFWVHRRHGDNFHFTTRIVAYQGDGAAKDAHDGWSQDENDQWYPGFFECCTVKADLTPLARVTPIKRNERGESFRDLDFKVGLWFGDTRLRACILWMEGKNEVRSEAVVIPPKFV